MNLQTLDQNMDQNRFKLEKTDLSYADFHSEVVKNLEDMTSSSSGRQFKQCIGNNVGQSDEIVKYMSSLPSYLETGNKFQDRALTFGVMDWGRLEQWHSTQKQLPHRSSQDLPSSSNLSSYFSTDGSYNPSIRPHNTPPSHRKSQRTTLQSHFSASPQQNVTPCVKLPAESPSLGKFHDSEIGVEKKMSKQYMDFHKSQMEARRKGSGGSLGIAASSSKGKMKIQEDECTEVYNSKYSQHYLEKNKNVVLLLPRDGPIPTTTANPTNKNQEEEKSTMSLEGSDRKMDGVAPSKRRSVSPLRRLSISMSKIGRNSTSRDNSVISSKARSSPLKGFSSSSRENSAAPQVSSKFVSDKSHSDRAAASDNLPKENPNIKSRARSSPLRRLLDPLFPSKATNSHQSAESSKEDSKTKVKEKLNLGSNIRNETERSKIVQALFQVAVKNGRPLFTFAVENNSEVLAATVRRLSSPLKDGSRWIYTFFTVQEVKKKNKSWLTSSNKVKGHGYVPNIVGQMKVSDDSVLNREFVLFSVNLRPSDQQILDVHPRDELAAIVVKFPSRKAVAREDGEDHFSTTVILPGGHHGLPSKGEPSPLIERWRSGGLCDCGGWDVGCRMTVLENQHQTCRKLNGSGVHLPINQFELFSEGEFLNEGPFFSMSPLKENIYSVEFNSSLSLLQVFSTCISVLECRKSSLLLSESSNFSEEKLSEETTALKQEERYVSYPPHSPVGRV